MEKQGLAVEKSSSQTTQAAERMAIPPHETDLFRPGQNRPQDLWKELEDRQLIAVDKDFVFDLASVRVIKNPFLNSEVKLH